MPWNYPFGQVFRFAAPSLMAGNVALLKHAPNVMECALAIEALFLEAGAPDSVFQKLLVDVDVVERIIAHDAVQGVTLTGSEYAASSVTALAGKHIKDEAMRRAIETRYGLGASVWTRYVERGERLAQRINAGAVFSMHS